jgi:hypothetical protein
MIFNHDMWGIEWQYEKFAIAPKFNYGPRSQAAIVVPSIQSKKPSGILLENFALWGDVAASEGGILGKGYRPSSSNR